MQPWVMCVGKPGLAGERGGLRPGAWHSKLRETPEAEADRVTWLTRGGVTENILGTCTCAEHRGKGGCLVSGRCRRSIPCGQQGSRPGAVCPPLEWDTFALAAPYPVLSSTAGGIYGSSQVVPVVKKPTCQCRRHKRLGFDPWVGKILWRRAQQPTPAFLPGESRGQRSLAGCSPWGHTESDMTE